MQLLATGINHVSAPVAVREQVTFAPDQLQQSLNELTSTTLLDEALILSTCNRTEIYGVFPLERACITKTSTQIYQWLCNHHAISLSSLSAHCYLYSEETAVRHLLRVASGLDSMVLGEPQILGQLKQAYRQAQQAGTMDTLLNRLCQHAFSTAKRVRTETAVGVHPLSIASMAVNLSRQIFGDLKEQTALLIGAGETIELVAYHLEAAGVQRILIANRTREHAEKLVEQFPRLQVMEFSEVAQLLEYSDIVISSTGASLPIVHLADVKQAIKRRKHRPIFMADLAVPRDIHPDIASLSDVYLYSLDELSQFIQQNQQARKEAALVAEHLVGAETSEFLRWLRLHQAKGAICELRYRAEQARQQEIATALADWRQGKDPQQVLERLSYKLTQKLLHSPTHLLREIAQDEDPALFQKITRTLDLG